MNNYGIFHWNWQWHYICLSGIKNKAGRTWRSNLWSWTEELHVRFLFPCSTGPILDSIKVDICHIAIHGHIIKRKMQHYDDVIMGAIASQITSLTIVYSTVYSDADQRKHQSSASLAFVRGIHRGPVNSPHKWPVTRKKFPFDDVIMRWW